ncbi:aspartic peptidase domain-containing protein [Corynascus novoguineensis]|uniref:Aspartic peptidase domain-containing protein n=1 Tax=Corynascus novoguineensis TaxID=1126955 RepID=A0AAN7HS18_9PEZI|nr:aspartic peptidase domain-containing protein [Corynascus novoguineensis]
MHFATLGAFVALIAGSYSRSSQPDPLVIPPSEYFEGNDGPWSTFDVRLGTPEQYVRVLVSTASPYSLVPFSEQACSTSVFITVPPDCAVSRGNLFDHNQSSTWHDVGLYGINQNGVGLEANLGYERRVQFGFESFAIGLTGPGLDNQTVGGIATAEPFYLGIFGINPQPLNFSTLGNHSTSSFFTTLKEKKKIPSLSWSYTAGAQYRLKQVYGQLIFGGYDTSRFKENLVSFSMADDITRDLVVALQSISYSGSTSATLLSDPINIMIDSTDPNLWLPPNVCDAFEEAFGLTLDNESGLYLVNETHRNTLLDWNAQVSFRLSDVKSGGDTVTIVLPYAAFDLTAKNPLVEKTSHYFPLRRANNSAQYTLGRTFLQEAYLSVDYERKIFNLSACAWNQGAEENIVAIPSRSDSNSADSGDPRTSSSSGLSSGAIAGIVVGSVIGTLLVGAILAVTILRKRRKWLGAGCAAAANKDLPPPDDSVLEGPVFNSSSSARHGSTPDSSVPYSAADISAATAGSRSSTTAAAACDARPASSAVGDVVGLDGRDTLVRPDTELDGNDTIVRGPSLPSVAENPTGVYELPGSDVVTDGNLDRRSDAELDKRPCSSPLVGSSRPRDAREQWKHSPPSPLTSTTDRNQAFGRDSLVSDL